MKYYVQLNIVGKVYANSFDFFISYLIYFYFSYLRSVIMTWFSEENIDVSFVLPNYEDDEAISDSDSDSEIHRVDLGQTYATPTMAMKKN